MPDLVPDSPLGPLAPQFHALRLGDMSTAAAGPAWLWQGYLAGGGLTLLTSPWKAGKTTLTAALLARMHDGRPLAGGTVRPGKALVVSEENVALWQRRSARFEFGPHACWLCRPFPGKPTPAEWQALLDHIVELHRQHDFALLVIDPLASFLPGPSENDATAMLAALLPLQRLTSAGLAVLVLHHPRKQASAEGQWARGSGALSAHVDVLIEMHYYSAASSDDRRRTLLAYSRYDETPRRRVIELNAAGTDYDSLGDLEDDEYRASWPVLRLVLEQAANKLTRTEVRDAWPVDTAPPAPVTLWRWLERGVANGTVQRDGSGRRHEPYRYWLRGHEEKGSEVAQQVATDEPTG